MKYEQVPGLVIKCPGWFRRADFQAWILKHLNPATGVQRVATWSSDVIDEGSDTFILYDNGEGSDFEDIPEDIWGEICKLCESLNIRYCMIWLMNQPEDITDTERLQLAQQVSLYVDEHAPALDPRLGRELQMLLLAILNDSHIDAVIPSNGLVSFLRDGHPDRGVAGFPREHLLWQFIKTSKHDVVAGISAPVAKALELERQSPIRPVKLLDTEKVYQGNELRQFKVRLIGTMKQLSSDAAVAIAATAAQVDGWRADRGVSVVRPVPYSPGIYKKTWLFTERMPNNAPATQQPKP